MQDLPLAKYLYTFERKAPNLDLDERILGDFETLGSIAGAWRDRRKDIEAVAYSQIAKLERYMVRDMLPVETTVIRQAISEIEALLTLFAAYEAEYTRRDKSQREGTKDEDKAEHDPVL